MFGENEIMELVQDLNKQIQEALNTDDDYCPLILSFILYLTPNHWEDDLLSYENYCKVSNIIKNNSRLKEIFLRRAFESEVLCNE